MARHAGRLSVQRKAPATDDKATAGLLCGRVREFQVPRQASHITHGVHRQHKTVSLPRPAHAATLVQPAVAAVACPKPSL